MAAEAAEAAPAPAPPTGPGLLKKLVLRLDDGTLIKAAGGEGGDAKAAAMVLRPGAAYSGGKLTEAHLLKAQVLLCEAHAKLPEEGPLRSLSLGSKRSADTGFEVRRRRRRPPARRCWQAPAAACVGGAALPEAAWQLARLACALCSAGWAAAPLAPPPPAGGSPGATHTRRLRPAGRPRRLQALAVAGRRAGQRRRCGRAPQCTGGPAAGCASLWAASAARSGAREAPEGVGGGGGKPGGGRRGALGAFLPLHSCAPTATRPADEFHMESPTSASLPRAPSAYVPAAVPPPQPAYVPPPQPAYVPPPVVPQAPAAPPPGPSRDQWTAACHRVLDNVIKNLGANAHIFVEPVNPQQVRWPSSSWDVQPGRQAAHASRRLCITRVCGSASSQRLQAGWQLALPCPLSLRLCITQPWLMLMPPPPAPCRRSAITTQL